VNILSWFRIRRVDGRSSNNVGGSNRATTAAREKLPEEFSWLDGRRHVNAVPYVMPKDLDEVNRLDFQHYMMKYVLQRNYVSPITDPRSILDVGCGTGRWAHEMAVSFPRAKVFGLDVIPDSTVDPQTLPTNYRFVQGNVLEELPFPDKTFDFVHQRFLHMAVPSKSWPHVIAELARVTRPGGWIEVSNTDTYMHNPGPAMKQLSEWGYGMSRAHGIDPLICSQISIFMQNVRIANVQTYRVDLPIGSWGGRLGIMAATDLQAFSHAIAPRVAHELHIDVREYQRLAQIMRQEWENNKSYFSVYISYGQVPSTFV
jgi:ubiquinone/menaquinone biosynthesis C-methylase UbiE